MRIVMLQSDYDIVWHWLLYCCRLLISIVCIWLQHHLEGWDVLYNHPEYYITKPVCYDTQLYTGSGNDMLYNMLNSRLYNMCYTTNVV